VRALYLLAAYLAAPLHAGLLMWRSRCQRSQWRRFGERFGLGPAVPGRPVWVHAASVGEVQIAAVLVKGLRERFPGTPVLLTAFTPTGIGRAQALSPSVATRCLPYDLPGSVRRFLDRVQPRLAIMLETELWPNFYRQCRRKGVPLVIASARLSARSARRYRLLGALVREALATATVAAQSAADAERFVSIGADSERVHVIGNLKFDFTPPADIDGRGKRLRARYAANRPLWVAGSTHEGEEQAVLTAHRRLREVHPQALLVLAPRHPSRFAEVGALLGARGIEFVSHSRAAAAQAAGSAEVLLLDTLGELLDFYAAADAAFVGGSLVPVGGHNLLEPASLGVPLLSGPHQFNAAEIARLLTERGGAVIVHNAAEIAVCLSAWLSDAGARHRIGAIARAVVEENRGALQRLLRLLEPMMSLPRPGPHSS
jgi:3-deoxy-D-manno-octulosonic-acid transferase